MLFVVEEPAVVTIEVGRGVDEDEAGDDEEGEGDDRPAGEPSPDALEPEVDEDNREHGDKIDDSDNEKQVEEAQNKAGAAAGHEIGGVHERSHWVDAGGGDGNEGDERAREKIDREQNHKRREDKIDQGIEWRREEVGHDGGGIGDGDEHERDSLDEDDDKNEQGRNERTEGVVESVAEFWLAAGEEMSEKIDRDEPHNQEECNHEDSLDFAHAGIKAAGRDRRDEEKAGFGEVADLTLGEAGAGLVDAGLELLIEVFTKEADKNNISNGHNGDESEESFPMFEDELESCHGMRK